MIDPHKLPFRYLVFFFTLCFHVSFFKNLILSSNYRLKFNYKESFFFYWKRFTDKYLELFRVTIRPKYTHSFDSDLRTPLRKKPRLRHNALQSNSLDRDKFRLIGNKKKHGQACNSKLTKDDYFLLFNYRPVSFIVHCFTSECVNFETSNMP